MSCLLTLTSRSLLRVGLDKIHVMDLSVPVIGSKKRNINFEAIAMIIDKIMSTREITDNCGVLPMDVLYDVLLRLPADDRALPPPPRLPVMEVAHLGQALRQIALAAPPAHPYFYVARPS